MADAIPSPTDTTQLPAPTTTTTGTTTTTNSTPAPATPTTSLSAEQIATLLDTATQQAFRSSGAGGYYSLYQTILSQYDRFGVNASLQNHENVGYTFITRPKLNLSTTSLRQDRIMALLDTADGNSLPFAIRCYLDTFYSNRADVTALAQKCPFFNIESPFLIPLSNNLISVGGWPDPTLETETTDGGFFSEDMTIVKGSDRLNRTYDLTLTFRDIQGGFVLSMLYFWLRYIELVVRGDTIAYPEDIAARRVNYTCSIYRFVMDPSRQFITKWAKATGCFPKSLPIGNIFNFSPGEKFITSAAQYSVPFTCNKVEIMDPIIFRDFNTISKRFSPTLHSGATVIAPITPDANFIGLPLIDVIGGYNRLNFLCNKSDLDNPLATAWQTLNSAMKAINNGTSSTATPSFSASFTDGTFTA